MFFCCLNVLLWDFYNLFLSNMGIRESFLKLLAVKIKCSEIRWNDNDSALLSKQRQKLFAEINSRYQICLKCVTSSLERRNGLFIVTRHSYCCIGYNEIELDSIFYKKLASSFDRVCLVQFYFIAFESMVGDMFLPLFCQIFGIFSWRNV